MKSEQYFLKYSFPYAHVLVEMGSITQEKFEELKEAVLNNKVLDKGELMMLFPSAFRRMMEVAVKMNKDVWDMKVIKAYFHNHHNMYIDKRDSNYAKFGGNFRDFCKVYKCKVIHKEEGMLTVECGDTTRNVLSDILPDAKVGDMVTIHQGFAVERLENE